MIMMTSITAQSLITAEDLTEYLKIIKHKIDLSAHGKKNKVKVSSKKVT